MHIVVLVTTKDRTEAQRIARSLLQAKLIACANIVGGIESLFLWEGKINASKETLLILKTKKTLFRKCEAKVKSLHSYATPEIIALPVVAGSRAYLNWIGNSVC